MRRTTHWHISVIQTLIHRDAWTGFCIKKRSFKFLAVQYVFVMPSLPDLSFQKDNKRKVYQSNFTFLSHIVTKTYDNGNLTKILNKLSNVDQCKANCVQTTSIPFSVHMTHANTLISKTANKLKWMNRHHETSLFSKWV